MAALKRHCCTVCGKSFSFASKLARHLQSASHKSLCEALEGAYGHFKCSVETMEDLSSMLQSSAEVMAEDGDGIKAPPSPNFMPASDTLNQNITDEQVDGEEQSEEMSEDECGLNTSQNPSDNEWDWSELVDELMSTGDSEASYHPFPNETVALLYFFVHSPRPVGESNLKFLWYILRKQNPQTPIPALSTVKDWKLPGDIKPTKFYADNGLPFYANLPSQTLPLLFGNPETARNLVRLPVAGTHTYKEIYEGEMWNSDKRFQSPMVDCHLGHVYVNDFIQFEDPDLGQVIGKVIKFYQNDKTEVFATIEPLLTLEQLVLKSHLTEETVSAAGLKRGYYYVSPQLSLEVSILTSLAGFTPLSIMTVTSLLPSIAVQELSAEDTSQYTAQHPVKHKAGGRPVVMCPLILFSDDTSGNRTKKWNKFDCWAYMLAGLPREQNAQLHNIHFISTSNKLNSIQQSKPLVQDLLTLEQEGIVVYDAHIGKEVLVLAPVLCLLADNVRASEVANHLGGRALLFCRICKANRTRNPLEVEEGRTKEETKQKVHEMQLEPITSKRKLMERETGISERDNPLLDLTVDFHSCTPVECLHTILLGAYKYLLSEAMIILNAEQKQELLALIKAVNFSGIRGRLLGNVCRYYRQFFGRDYKVLAQIAPFTICNLLPIAHKKAWMKLSQVFKLAYSGKFEPSRAAQCERICKEFVQAIQVAFPDMLQKPKIHLLLHLVDCMKKFGPASAFNTERCESYLSLLRLQNIYANRHAPSRDIAVNFMKLEHLRFLCSGAYYEGRRQCGEGLHRLYTSAPVQHLLNGIPNASFNADKNIYSKGCLRKLHRNEFGRPVQKALEEVELHDFTCTDGHITYGEISANLKLPEDVRLATIVFEYASVVGESGELINRGNWLHFKQHVGQPSQYALLVGCFQDSGDKKDYVAVRKLKPILVHGLQAMSAHTCPLFELETVVTVIPSSLVITDISVVHHCQPTCRIVRGHCDVTVEREHVDAHDLVHNHDYTNNRFCYNVYCLNNNMPVLAM